MRALTVILVCCSACFFVPLPVMGAESGKSLYDKINALDAKASATDQLAMDKALETGSGADMFNAIWRFGGNETIERMALEKELKAQAASGDPESAFYWGYRNFEWGLKAARSSEKLHQDWANDQFKEAYLSFKIASDAGVGAASWNIAVMYEQGNGVTLSKLAAAEWYYKAGRQYFKSGEREKALAVLERIEKVDKNHSDAIKLRAILYPPDEKK
jgi:TPR repeat protein